MRRLVTSRLIRIYTVCHAAINFVLGPQFATVDMPKFKDLKADFLKSGVKGLSGYCIATDGFL